MPVYWHPRVYRAPRTGQRAGRKLEDHFINLRSLCSRPYIAACDVFTAVHSTKTRNDRRSAIGFVAYRKLNLTDNFFNGVLSSAAGQLRELEELRLDVNQVCPTVPLSVVLAASLAHCLPDSSSSCVSGFISLLLSDCLSPLLLMYLGLSRCFSRVSSISLSLPLPLPLSLSLRPPLPLRRRPRPPDAVTTLPHHQALLPFTPPTPLVLGNLRQQSLTPLLLPPPLPPLSCNKKN